MWETGREVGALLEQLLSARTFPYQLLRSHKHVTLLRASHSRRAAFVANLRDGNAISSQNLHIQRRVFNGLFYLIGLVERD